MSSASNYQSGRSANDSFEQINANISTNIYKLKQNVNQLNQQAKLLATAKDTPQLRDSILETIENTNRLGSSTNNFFKQINQRQLKKDELLIIERAKRSYKEEFETYSRISKQISEKMHTSKYAQQAVNNQSNLLSFEENEYNERNSLLQKQRQIDLNIKVETLQDREQRIHQLESDIIDVNAIMKDLSTMVYEQSSIIDNISTNIESTHSNVETGNEQLTLASKYATKYRKKVIILIVIALIILLTLGLIIYFSIKK